jgi:hypothetical protein
MAKPAPGLATLLQTWLPEASVAPGNIRASDRGLEETKGKSRTSRGWKLPPLSGPSLMDDLAR